MLLDARQIADGEVLEADVALIGAGAAGITLARELAAYGHDVLLLESGGFDPEGQTFDLYRGEMDTTLKPFQERYLFTSRQRFFGGTTNHWGGMCRPLDPIDFEARSWIPESGWPLDRDSLQDFYRRACEVVQIAPMDAPPPGEPKLFRDPEGELTTRWFHKSPPTRFGQLYRQELVDSERVRLVLQANVLRVAVGESGSAVTGLDVGTLSGRRFRARAKQYVLATGGIENARLLLLSNDVQKNGLGNDRDLVGRYFADHPHVRAGNLFFTDPIHAELYEWHSSEEFGHSVMPTWVLSEEVQRREQLLNQMVELNPRWVKRGVLFDAATEFDIGPWDRTAKRPPWRWASFLTTLEVTPNRENRVSLGDELDALGQRRVRLNWRLSADDGRRVRAGLDQLVKILGRAGAARVRVVANEANPWPKTDPGLHHMGTTRMSDDPARGVVDSDCRIYGMANLHIAGSSVFPTYGYANPTLTIVALCLRLAEHLDGGLRR